LRLPSTINALLTLPPTINALIAVAVKHQRTHCRRRQPSTHSSPLSSTINALIAVAVNHRLNVQSYRIDSIVCMVSKVLCMFIFTYPLNCRHRISLRIPNCNKQNYYSIYLVSSVVK
jgi:hypothetical protein